MDRLSSITNLPSLATLVRAELTEGSDRANVIASIRVTRLEHLMHIAGIPYDFYSNLDADAWLQLAEQLQSFGISIKLILDAGGRPEDAIVSMGPEVEMTPEVVCEG